MFKKISLFLVLALVIGALSACANSGKLSQVELTEEMKTEIERAYIASRNTIDLVEPGKGDHVYVGTINDMDIISLWGSLYGYQDENFISLDEQTKLLIDQVLAGTATIPVTASEERKSEIENKWQEKKIKQLFADPDLRWTWMQEEGTHGSAYCYGTYNDYYIFLRDNGFTYSDPQFIGGVEFRYGNDFFLCAYKDGKVYELEELYNSGDIPLLVIKAVAERNRERFAFAYYEE